MSSATDLPADANALATAFVESGEGEWKDLLSVAERMGYQTPIPEGIMPNMTQRLVGTANPSISFTLDDTGQRVAEAVVLP